MSLQQQQPRLLQTQDFLDQIDLYLDFEIHNRIAIKVFYKFSPVVVMSWVDI